MPLPALHPTQTSEPHDMADTETPETIETALAQCDGDVLWLVSQLERWPVRVNPLNTTNIRYLHETASAILAAAKGVDDLPPPLDAALIARLQKAHDAFRAKHRHL